MPFVPLIPLQRCRRDSGVFVECSGRELAVFRLADPDGTYVIDNTCPHAGGNLSGGSLDGTVVSCPIHHWEFDLETGFCTHSERARVRRYPAEVRNGVVWVDLPEQSG